MLTPHRVVTSVTDIPALSPHDLRSGSRTSRRETSSSNATRTQPHTVFAETRRTYATNLQVEYGYDVSFVQLQLGHEHASTTSIYTLAAPDYRARELERVLSATLARSNARLDGPTPKES
jgi:site-specific recombinase XerD